MPMGIMKVWSFLPKISAKIQPDLHALHNSLALLQNWEPDYFKIEYCYCRVGLLSACAYNFRRKLSVKIILSVRCIRLVNNYGVFNMESLHCNRVVCGHHANV